MRTRRRPAVIGAAFLPALAVSACVTSTGELRKLDRRLEFIQPGETSQQQISAELGEPTVTFEEGRLAVYIFTVGKVEPNADLHHPGDIVTTQLVVEFDDQGIVQRHQTLVPP